MAHHAHQRSQHLWRRGFTSWKVLLALVLALMRIGPAFAESEAGVKAAYLFNFAKLAEWPAAAFENAKSPLVIGVVGHDAVTDDLMRRYARMTANGRPVEIRRLSAGSPRELRACHIIFVPQPENADNIITSVQGAPVLVVGESEGFARRGGALAFVKQEGTLKFEANPKAAARNGVTVSSRLLRVACSVVGK